MPRKDYQPKKEYQNPVDANRLTSILEGYTVRQAEAAYWLYELMTEQKWTYTEAGKHINRDGSNISKMFNGCYPGNLNAFTESILNFKEDWIATNGISTPGFIETWEAQRIFFACEKATNNCEVALIYGDLGAGKTTGGMEYCQRRPRETHYYRCESGRAYGSFIRSFGRSLGLTQNSIDPLKEAIFAKLRRKKTQLIFIDEFHLPFTTTHEKSALKCAEFIRDLHDILGCGIVLCGTKVIPETLKNSFWSKALEQIIDRGNTIVNLKKRAGDKDLREFYAYYQLPKTPTKEASSLIRTILKKHSLRKLVFALRDGSRAAASMGDPNSWDHFVDAFTLNKSLDPKDA